MDVALGVSVTDDDAQIVLVDAAAAATVIDQSRVTVADGDIDALVSTLVSTDRALADTGHRLVATRVSGAATERTGRLVQALTAAGLVGVTAEPAADPGTAAALSSGADTAAAHAVARDAAATQLSPAVPADAVNPADPADSADSADSSMTALSPQGDQLAYSEVDEGDDLDDLDAVGGADEFTPFDTARAPAASQRPRALLLGSTVAAAVVVGFAALAVGVAIGVKPVNSQQAIRTQDDAVPGKYFPTSPGQGVQPDAENWTVVEHLPPPGVSPTVRTFEPKSLTSPVHSARSLIDMYPDGTFGVRDAAAPLPAAPAVVPPVPGVEPVPGAVDPFAQLLVARLIPDFSLFTPIAVLYYMSNLVPATVQSAAVVGANVLTDLVAGVADPTLADLGTVVAVSPTQGALFAAPAATTVGTDAASSFDPATVTASIPRELFSATVTPERKSALLPSGVTEISELPSTADTPGVSPLSTPITDVDALKPTLVGTGPPVAPQQNNPPVFPDVAPTPAQSPAGPATEPPLATPTPGQSRPGEDRPAPDTDAVDAPDTASESPPSSATPGKPPAVSSQPKAPEATPSAPESATDKPSTKPAPSEESAPTEAPTEKPAPTEAPSEASRAPVTQAPAETPAPAPSEAPAPSPVEMPTEAPTQQAPRPAPTREPVEVPTQAPKPQPAPQRPAPVQQAPAKPDVTMPDVKMPSFGDDSSG